MVITLTGPNTFAAHQALQQMITQFVNANGAHGVERVDGEALELRRLPELLQGASLFAPERLVIIKGAAVNKPLWEALGDWIDKTADGTTLVIAEPAPDKRTRTYKLLKQKTDFKEFAAPTDAELAGWLQTIAKKLGAELAPVQAHYLLARAGRDQWRLHNEIIKLASADSPITNQTIDELVEPTSEGNAFALLDATLAGDTQKVGVMLAELRTQEDPYKLVGLLASQVHALALMAMAGSRGADQIARDSGLHPFVLGKTKAIAARLGQASVTKIAERVALCDIQIKSTGADPWDVVQLCLQTIAA